MMKAKDIQTTIFPYPIIFDKEVCNEKKPGRIYYLLSKKPVLVIGKQL